MILDFVVRVCDDVLVDIIRYGKRLELSGFDGLEHIGHRFFRIIDRCFIAAPFVFFPNLDCTFSIRGRDLKTIIKCEDLPIEHYCEEVRSHYIYFYTQFQFHHIRNNRIRTDLLTGITRVALQFRQHSDMCNDAQ